MNNIKCKIIIQPSQLRWIIYSATIWHSFICLRVCIFIAIARILDMLQLIKKKRREEWKCFFVVVCAHRIPYCWTTKMRTQTHFVRVCVCGFLIAGLPALVWLFFSLDTFDISLQFYFPCFENNWTDTFYIRRRQCDEQQQQEMKPINVWINEGAHDRRSKSIYHWIIIITFCVVVLLLCWVESIWTAWTVWTDGEIEKQGNNNEYKGRRARTLMHKSLG